MARNAITTLLSLEVAAWTVTQGDATRTCRIIGMICMFLFAKWFMMDTWDAVEAHVRKNRKSNIFQNGKRRGTRK